MKTNTNEQLEFLKNGIRAKLRFIEDQLHNYTDPESILINELATLDLTLHLAIANDIQAEPAYAQRMTRKAEIEDTELLEALANAENSHAALNARVFHLAEPGQFRDEIHKARLAAVIRQLNYAARMM